MKKCETCRYGSEYELDKPCIVYREDCPLYQKEGDAMNREEAIKILENERDNHINGCNGVFYETRTEAVNMAIQALEHPERNVVAVVPCGDTISRQAVIDITWEEPSYTDALNVLTEVRDKVESLPSVNPQPKTGHCTACKHYTSGEQDGSCDSYICKGYSDWESDNCN